MRDKKQGFIFHLRINNVFLNIDLKSVFYSDLAKVLKFHMPALSQNYYSDFIKIEYFEQLNLEV